jgi:hypothetical protein
MVQDISLNGKFQKVGNECNILIPDCMMEQEVAINDIFDLKNGFLRFFEVLVNNAKLIGSRAGRYVLSDFVF